MESESLLYFRKQEKKLNENKVDPTKNYFNFYLNEKKISTLYQALVKRMALHV
jgi:hypothetical protein